MEDASAASSDLRLVQAVRAGDPAAVERFVERMRCVPRILAAKNARLGSPLARDELADVAQEVFAAVWSRLDEFAGRAALESWVYSFCVLTLRRAAAGRSLGAPRDAAYEPPAGGSGTEGLERLDEEHLYAALRELAPEEAEAVCLKQLDGLTFEAIAERLRVSPNTVKTRYYRALVRLRRRLVPLFKEAGR
jgi:RNA polymerase sigma-70 factor (ECF subfamily)